MEKDHGIRFSDEIYATKDDVKRALNMSSIDSIWEKVTTYRSYYLHQTPLKNVERVPFSVVLPPRLTSNIVSLEKRMSKLLIKYSRHGSFGSEVIRDFDRKEYTNILRILAEINEINIGEDTLRAIIDESLPTIPVEYLVINNYYLTLKYYKNRYAGPISPMLICSMYSQLLHTDFDPTSLVSYYRKNELNDKADHVFIGRHYEAAPIDRIDEMLSSLCDFLNNSSLFGIVKSVIAYFYILYIKPFDDFNEEIAILTMKYVLAHCDNEDIATFLSLEELLQKDRKNYIKSLNLESEMKLDFTYILSYIVQLIDEMVADIENNIQSLDAILLFQEQRREDHPSVEQHVRQILVPPSPQIEKQEDNEEEQIMEVKASPSYNVERKVALPVLPVGLDENDAELVAQHLIELYPTMRKNQAEFYARHCTIGKYYTISQYKKEQNVAYETARTSMDNLVNLGFYKKENIRNKFVYTPTLKDN